jgi:hypothetical protein
LLSGGILIHHAMGTDFTCRCPRFAALAGISSFDYRRQCGRVDLEIDCEDELTAFLVGKPCDDRNASKAVYPRPRRVCSARTVPETCLISDSQP